MKNFFVVTNCLKDKEYKTTNTIKEYLELKGCSCTVYKHDLDARETTSFYTDVNQIPEDTQCILVLGGDGTLIQAASDIAERDIPMLGINLGTLGYLTEVDESSITEALNQLIEDDYEVDERIMLLGISNHKGSDLEAQRALNDIVITRTGPLHIINFKLYVNNELLNEYSADGIIVSTPTGSTGYSLSAGGPIVEPNANVIVVTPICAHTLNTRSIILSAEHNVKIEIGQGRREETEITAVSFDGGRMMELVSGDYIRIKKAKKITKIIKMSKVSFLEVLRKKMTGTNWNQLE